MLQQYRTKGFHHSFPPTRFQSAPTRAPAGASLTSTPRPKDWAFPQQLWGKHSSNKMQGLTHSPCRGVSATDTMPSSPGAAPGGPTSTSARCSGSVLTHTRPSHAQQCQCASGRQLCSSPIAPQTTGPQALAGCTALVKFQSIQYQSIPGHY